MDINNKKNEVNRRNFLYICSLTLITQFTACGNFSAITSNKSVNKIRFGIAADPHYADRDVAGTRFYRESLAKMCEFIDLMNKEKVDFVIELGDFKDMDGDRSETSAISYLRSIEKEFKRFAGPSYHVLGNHDEDCITKEQFLSNVENKGIPPDKTFYSFKISGTIFIVLDANFKSDGYPYAKGNFDWTDSNIPSHEIEWLKEILESSKSPVIVFVHQQLDGASEHTIKNSEEVRNILSNSGKVAAVFQGHNHTGGYSLIDGVHYY